ncbi:MAG TPA: thrombospondin type 3 repeat-containing protein [Kofleriaceae bacterium]|jgi:hypothetical protein
MKYAWMLVALVGCGGGGSGADPDAATDVDGHVADAGEDSGGGIQPDAFDPSGDYDSDGVLNGVDDCPTVADPAQFDLDGDGIGWMCDPIETKAFPIPAGFQDVALAIGGATMGGAIKCTGTCSHVAFAVGPAGIQIAQDPADAWVSDNVQRGYVPGENHVLWSLVNGTIGDQAATTGTFSPRVQDAKFTFGRITLDWFVHGALRVLTVDPEATGTSYRLIAPNSDGTVTTVVTSDAALLRPQIVGDTSPELVFGVSGTSEKSVQKFAPGMTASAPVVFGSVVLDHLDDVAYVTRSSFGGVYGFCARKVGKRYFVETNNGPLHIYEAPDGSCSVDIQETRDHRFVMFGDAFYVLDGVGHAFTAGNQLTLKSEGVPAIVAGQAIGAGGVPLSPVFAVDATGEHPVSTSGGVGNGVSQHGDTTHFVTIESGMPKLVRYRNGLTSTSDLPAIGPDETWTVFTTNEGAAIATTTVRAVVMASQSMSPTVVDFDNVDLLISSGQTFFVASHNAATSQPALYRYTEVAGAPQYTALTPEVNQNDSFKMWIRPVPTNIPSTQMDQQPETPWFVYQKENDYCRRVRPVVMGSAVMLVGNYDCDGFFAGVTPDGKSVVLDNGIPHIEVGDGTTFTTVAKGEGLQLLYATPGSNLVLGWYGFGSHGPFVCSASHPDRCWASPGSLNDTFDELRWVPLDPEHPDALHIVLTTHPSDQMIFTSMKTVGPGNLPQPL